MGPLNTFEYPIDACSDEGYNDIFQSSRLSWYCSDDFDESRLQSAFSDMGITEESDEGRLSRALQSWMPEYVITSIEPMEKPPREPVFSGKLGKDRNKIIYDKIERVPSAVKKSGSKKSHSTTDSKKEKKSHRSTKSSKGGHISRDKKRLKVYDSQLTRASSEDSISTHYSSLFEISSFEEKPEESSHSRLKRRKKQKHELSSRTSSPPHSKWYELSTKQKSCGAFDKHMRAHTAVNIDTFGLFGEFESEAMALMEPYERKLIFNSAKGKGIRLTKELTKSGSTTTLNTDIPLHSKRKPQRVLSAGHKPNSKGLNLEEARQQLARERLVALRHTQNKSGRRNSRHRRLSSRMSIRSEISSNISCATPSFRSLTPSTEITKQETVWKGDKEILEMDLRRGLTTRVQKRIKTTTSALERVTGYGENNSLQKVVGRCSDFPQFIDDDYGLRPKIVQKMRISPYLSNVIREDIKVRMGRPRYHEIRIKDLEWWNRGQPLNKAHRNLKVFNWLHSLREDDFEHILDLEILDKPPEYRDEIAIMHVESADEPDLKPLYRTDFFK